MRWMKEYQLFLFDLDGLLVDTEPVHYEAYRAMCALHGVEMTWSLEEYCLAAHYSSEQLRGRLLSDFPQLREAGPWEQLYAEKQQAARERMQNGVVTLMPGAGEFLEAVHQEGGLSCVVTHSHHTLVEAIRAQHPLLDAIPHWITRKDYQHPKPHPESYEMAMKAFMKEGERAIGFEDTPKGLRALLQTEAQPVLVSRVPYPETPQLVEEGAWHVDSLEELFRQ